jgi:hypothetical protein
MADEPLRAEDAVLAAMRSSRHLSGLWTDPRKALEIIRPYADCEEYSVPDHAPNPDGGLRKARSIVCAITADCYRELGDVGTAAAWYRRAGQSWKVGGFPGIYADMVLQHGLDDHYGAALDYLRHNLTDWQSKSLLARLYWHVVSGWWLRPWDYRGIWRTFFRQRHLVAQLEARVAGREEQGGKRASGVELGQEQAEQGAAADRPRE